MHMHMYEKLGEGGVLIWPALPGISVLFGVVVGSRGGVARVSLRRSLVGRVTQRGGGNCDIGTFLWPLAK